MLLRIPAISIWLVGAVIFLIVVGPGCARKTVFLEANHDLMPCEGYGGKVSVNMRADPALPDRGPVAHAVTRPVMPAAQFEPVPQTPAQAPPAQSPPLFFAPPKLAPTQGTAMQPGYPVSAAPMANTVFASHSGTVAFDPAYNPTPSANGYSPPPTLSPPVLQDESFGSYAPYDSMATCDAAKRSCFGQICWEAKQNIRSDHRHYYSRRTMAGLAYGLVLGSVLANTSMDQDVQDWYQQDVRSQETDNFAEFWKTFGEGQLFIPAYACLAVAGTLLDDWPVTGTLGEFGARTTRAYLVGAPPMLFMQFMLGASRPGETSHGSHWRPFEDTNAVSGHSFVGAVPFITAAKMTDSFFLKTGFYACSALTGFSRVNDDDHYFSQAVLGWWMAYLACEAIVHTESDLCGFTLVPITSPRSVGFAAIRKF